MDRIQGNFGAPTAAPGKWWQEMTGHHWWVLLVATLGWLFDSMDQRLFVLARTPALRELLPQASEAEVTNYAGYATTIFILGWATGGLVFGLFGDRWGRTRTMILTILLYSLFTGLSAVARGWLDFALYRFLCGMGIGGEYAAGVALIAEVMPDRARPYCLGLLQGLAALGQVAGSAISLAIGPQAEIEGVAGWRWLFVIGILPALLVVLIRFSLREPESWLRARDEGRRHNADEFHKQLGDLGEIFRDRRWRYHTAIGMTLGMAGQLGLWGIGFWTPELIRGSLLEARRLEVAETPGIEAGHLSLAELAAVSTRDAEQAQGKVHEWKAEEDRLVAQGTLLQDLAGMLGIYAFTLATSYLGRRWTFAIAYLLALGATLLTFGWLREAAEVYWMIPLLGFCVSSVYGGFAIYFPELYPTRLRSTGTGFCYNVARYVTALGPLTLGKLVLLYESRGFGMPLRPAAMTLATVYLVGVVVLPLAPETRGKPLPE
jgi:MFS family permease